MSTTTVRVTGMTCGHCVGAVSEELRRLDGVTGVDVDLQPGGVSVVTVEGERALDDAEVARAVDEAGYELAPEEAGSR